MEHGERPVPVSSTRCCLERPHKLGAKCPETVLSRTSREEGEYSVLIPCAVEEDDLADADQKSRCEVFS